ncbi:hypothetical protein [Nocardia thraciensis]
MATEESGNRPGNSGEPGEDPGKDPGKPDPNETAAGAPGPRWAEPTPPDQPTARFAEPGPAAPLPGMPNPFPDPAETGGAGAPPAQPPGGPAESEPPRSLRGSIQRQQAGVTQPRPPTVAEARARDKARQRAEEAQRAAEQALADKKKQRKRLLIGGVAVVGIAAVVGAGYLTYRAVTAPDEVTASCVMEKDGQQVVVPDADCERAQNASSTSGYHGGGFPGIFILGGNQYRYYYGGNQTVGRPPVGGSTVEPKNATVKTKSGTVIRGGLGSKSSSSSGGS